ncbi:MAG: formate/nitrite transporter family protein [bacterium]
MGGNPHPQRFDSNALGWVGFPWRNLLPVTMGNIIGGGVFVVMSYWDAYLRPSKS